MIEIKKIGCRMLRYKTLCFICGVMGLLCWSVVIAQDQTPRPSRQKTRIDLLHADIATADKQQNPDVMLLIGNVKLRHDSMYMYCDSALINNKNNSVEAYGDIHMEQGDTLFIYSDYLYYDGMTQLAMLRYNVRLVNRNNEMTTDSLNYDRLENLGYYFNGGKLTDEENVLTSLWGQYSPVTKIATFNHDVELVNPKFKLNSDTLKYNTNSKIATILGPSHITSDKNYIYSESGTYDTKSNKAYLIYRSYLLNEGKKLTGDSLFYDRNKQYGEAFGNVVFNDSIDKSALQSQYAFYDEAKGYAFANLKPVLVNYSDNNDSLYVHGDTIKMQTANINTDSVYRMFQIYHKVRAYKQNLQAVCDSLVYITKDSCMTMYNNPVIWTDNQQLLGEKIDVFMNDSTIDWAHIINQALAVEEKDSVHYNQLSGRDMKAYFKEKELHKIDVDGNVLVIFYPIDDKDSTIIGLNYSEGSLLKIEMKNKLMNYNKAAFIGKANGVLYPLAQAPSDKSKVPSFVWLDDIRPKNKEDIFEWKGKKEDQVIKHSDREKLVSPRQLRIKRKK